MARATSWLYYAAIIFNTFEEGLLENIPMCYFPVKLAYDVKEPIGGANETLPPILFLHGASAAKEYWFDVPQIVADRTKRRVFNLDARNHGDSEWSDVYNFDMNAQDVVHFMDSKSIGKAVLIGHSMGGISAIKVALSHPDSIEMVFIEDMYTKRVPTEQLQHVVKFFNAIMEGVAQIPTDLDEDAANTFVNDYLSTKGDVIIALGISKRHTSSKHSVALKRGDDGRYVLKANTKALVNALRSEESMMSENKGVYEGPAYFIYGTESAFKVGDEKEHILRHFPNAEFIPIEGVGHGVRLDVPEEFTDEVVKRILKEEA